MSAHVSTQIHIYARNKHQQNHQQLVCTLQPLFTMHINFNTHNFSVNTIKIGSDFYRMTSLAVLPIADTSFVTNTKIFWTNSFDIFGYWLRLADERAKQEYTWVECLVVSEKCVHDLFWCMMSPYRILEFIIYYTDVVMMNKRREKNDMLIESISNAMYYNRIQLLFHISDELLYCILADGK